MSTSNGLHRVTLALCAPCLTGAGGECHTPGCALWMNRAPDLPIKYDADGNIISVSAATAVKDRSRWFEAISAEELARIVVEKAGGDR